MAGQRANYKKAPRRIDLGHVELAGLADLALDSIEKRPGSVVIDQIGIGVNPDVCSQIRSMLEKSRSGSRVWIR